MSGFDTRGALLRTTAAAALLTLGTTAAYAQAELVGGGSTLAGPTYGKILTDLGLANTVAATGCPASGAFYYGLVGSGKGATGFINNDAAGQLGCPATPKTADDYGAGDLPLQSVFPGGTTTFQATYGYQLIQVPAFGTPVTIPFQLAGRTTNGSIKLTDAQLCGIFSGSINNWSSIPGSGSTSGIAVSYRQDSSGTSFLLTNHLAAVCAAGILPGGGNFIGTTKFATLFPGFTTDASGNTKVPNNTFSSDISGIGSGAVQANVHATANGVGYIGPDYTLIAANPTNPTLASPVASVGATVAKAVLPTVANTSKALVAAKAKPVAKKPDSFGVLVANPSKGYPIAGYTYLYVSSRYNNQADVTDLSTFLNSLYNSDGSFTTEQTEITNSGFVPVPGTNPSSKPNAGSFSANIVTDYLAARAVVPIVVNAGNGR